MKKCGLLIGVACLGSVFVALPGQAVNECVSVPVLSESQAAERTPQKTTASAQQLAKLAQSITVKVLSGHSNGSGILIQRQAQVYTVLTNEHVLTLGAPYRIQTPDGRSYEAEVLKTVSFKGNDLALLQFSSAENYTLASLGSLSSVAVGEPVVAAGFPFGASASGGSGFVVTAGQISLLPEKAIPRGYQIGYTNDIQKGMSGGPVLNSKGQVVGVNGMHAYPLWGDPYVFADGSKPCQATREVMSRSSWAIPVGTFMRLAANLGLPPLNYPVSLPPVAAPDSFSEPAARVSNGNLTSEGFLIKPNPRLEVPAAGIPNRNGISAPAAPNRANPVPEIAAPAVLSTDGFWIQPVTDASLVNKVPETQSPALSSGSPTQPNIAPNPSNKNANPMW
ncbi:S1 family peptidase [Kamptonema formosum]|uniref:S1 family peptidase n=1 Tax=Kamptonema formosum TaxID=331992 RepID=UPI0003648033|nr:serine protease [Oscillatoria sp. PCC 10802]